MTSELRCRGCGSLLGTASAEGLTIRRGGIEVTAARGSRLTVVCYRCSRLHLFEVPAEERASTDDVGSCKKGRTE